MIGLKLSRGKLLMLGGFFVLFIWSVVLLTLYFTRNGTVITDQEIFIGGQPVVLYSILSLFFSSLITIVGILLELLDNEAS